MKNYSEILLSDTFIIIKGAFIFLIGPLNAQIGYLLLVIMIDMYFGTKVAINKKEFKLSILYRKVTQKLIVYAGWIAIFNALDIVIGLPSTARLSIIILLLFIEIFSAIRNTNELGHVQLSIILDSLVKSFIKKDPTVGKILMEDENKKNEKKEEEKDE